jgi:DNA invertase Pin-like site-specific DNA recombinase
MRLHAYLRVSSAGQIDAWGLDRQEAAIKQYAKTHGHRIVRWFRDEGVSATVEAVDRPQLAEAIRTLGPKSTAYSLLTSTGSPGRSPSKKPPSS